MQILFMSTGLIFTSYTYLYWNNRLWLFSKHYSTIKEWWYNVVDKKMNPCFILLVKIFMSPEYLPLLEQQALVV